MCLIRTAYRRSYCRCALLVLHIFPPTDNMPCLYCTSSPVLKMLISTAHPHLLHILARIAQGEKGENWYFVCLSEINRGPLI